MWLSPGLETAPPEGHTAFTVRLSTCSPVVSTPEVEHGRMIQAAKIELDDLLKGASEHYTSTADRERLNAALALAGRIHSNERRPSGETFLEHARNVAAALYELGVDDVDTIVAALLHDALLPHTGMREKVLGREIGSAAAGLVRSVTVLDEYARRASQGKSATDLSLEAPQNREMLEVIRRALLSIIEGDIRIILIRMVDCLQDLNRASNMPRDMQRRVAWEAMHIYAPLANRLGIWHLKWQLEDISFRHLEPEKYREIARRLDDKRELRAFKVEKAATRLRRRLAEQGLKATVTGRPKHIYSIYRKMLRKGLDFDQIYDIQALRVILDPPEFVAPEAVNIRAKKDRESESEQPSKNGTGPGVSDQPKSSEPILYDTLPVKVKDEYDRGLCYQVLGAVHSLWQPVRGEFDDYIGSPKANGYKSLHTAVIDAETGLKLEVQIRSQRMHEEAERGIAAHWTYKEQDTRLSTAAQKRIQNLRELLATLQEAEDDPEGVPVIDIGKLEERIHVFTPNDDVVDLPVGSTPVDFAYHIHTEVGHRCRGARVNGKMVSLDYHLKSGDKVEIITDKRGRGNPNRDWMNPSLGYTASARTRSKIRHWFRQQERDQNISQGREVIERELKRLNLLQVYTVEDIAEALKFADVDDFLCKVGFGDIQTTQILGAVAVLQQSLRADDQELLPLLRAPSQKKRGLTVRGVEGLHTRLANCCSPISPEPIIGYVTRGQGVTIHRQDCLQLQNLTDRERLIEVGWGTQEVNTHPVPIVVTAYRRSGLIEDIVNTLRGRNIKVPKTKMSTEDSIMKLYMIAEVADLEQLTWLLIKLKNMRNVIDATRQKWS